MVRLGPRVLDWLFMIVVFAVLIEMVGFGYYSFTHLPSMLTAPSK